MRDLRSGPARRLGLLFYFFGERKRTRERSTRRVAILSKDGNLMPMQLENYTGEIALAIGAVFVAFGAYRILAKDQPKPSFAFIGIGMHYGDRVDN